MNQTAPCHPLHRQRTCNSRIEENLKLINFVLRPNKCLSLLRQISMPVRSCSLFFPRFCWSLTWISRNFDGHQTGSLGRSSTLFVFRISCLFQVTNQSLLSVLSCGCLIPFRRASGIRRFCLPEPERIPRNPNYEVEQSVKLNHIFQISHILMLVENRKINICPLAPLALLSATENGCNVRFWSCPK